MPQDQVRPAVSGVRGLARRMWASSGVTLAVGVGGVVGDVGLVLAVERRAVRLAPADERLLLAEAGAVPELDEHPDDAHHVVAAADGPGRLAVVRRRPTRSGRAWRPRRRRGWRCRRRSPSGCAAPGRPARRRRCGGCSRRASSAASACRRVRAHQLAQGEQVDVRGARWIVSSRSPWLRSGSSRSLARNGILTSSSGRAVGEAEALVEQRRADADHDRQVGGRRRVPRMPVSTRREGRVALLVGRPDMRRSISSVSVAEHLRQVRRGRGASTVNAAIRPRAGAGCVVMPVWCGAVERQVAPARAVRRPRRRAAQPAPKRAGADGDAAGAGDERRGARCGDGRRSDCSPSVPGTSARSSDRPASCPFERCRSGPASRSSAGRGPASGTRRPPGRRARSRRRRVARRGSPRARRSPSRCRRAARGRPPRAPG